MAGFTTEALVREKFQLIDTTLVPVSLMNRNIDDAHLILLRFLDPIFDLPSPAAAVVLGETLLAGAYLMRSLAPGSAFARRKVTVGGQRVEPSGKAEALHAEADAAEAEAWRTLEPYLRIIPSDKLAAATDSQSILGEG